ncbi:hypothetical protein WME76_39115 [Sorangium sp. So ce119]|uniref:hypothetical protein n=1 Tax=Sorangium sp. So ce119 TaxID=3133279 RepID=UPI003F61CCFC
METSAREQKKGERGGRWWARRLLVGLGVTVAAFGLWVAAHHVGQAPPPRLFTEADLPPLPPPSDNGWLLVAGPTARRAVLSIPPDLKDLLLPDQGQPLLERARARREAISAFLQTREAEGALRALEQATAMPRFADGCPLQLEPFCPILPLRTAQMTAALEALRRGTGGDWPGALSLSARLTRAAVDEATSSRSMFSHVVAIADLRLDLELSTALLDGYQQARARDAAPLDPGTLEALRAADAALGKLDLGELSARRAVIAEYITTRRAIEHIGQAATQKMLAQDFWSRPIFDEAATIEAINQRFSKLAAGAADPSLLPFASEAPRSGLFWWTYNPVGKMTLEALSLDWNHQIQQIEKERAHLDAARTRAREAMRPVLQGG